MRLFIVRFIILSVLILPHTASAQQWLAARHAGGSGDDAATVVAADRLGNTYVVGVGHGSAMFDSVAVEGQPVERVYLTKYDASHHVQWATVVATSASNVLRPTAMALDSSGNIVVAGQFFSSITFADDTVNGASNFDVYLAKLDTVGRLLWYRVPRSEVAGRASYNEITGIAADAGGNCIITGSMAGGLTFDSVRITSTGLVTFFLARIDGGGNVVWARAAEGSDGGSYGSNVAMAADGSYRFTGRFAGRFVFGGDTITSADSGHHKALIGTIGADGTMRWLNSIGDGLYSVVDTRVAVDGNGNAFVTGEFYDTLTFGTIRHFQRRSSGPAAIVVAYDRDGAYRWSRQSTGIKQQVYVNGVASDGRGGIYTTGSFRDSMNIGAAHLAGPLSHFSAYVTHLNAAGEVLTATAITAGDEVIGWSIAMAPDGTCALAGQFKDSVTIGSEELVAFGGSDMFVAWLDARVAGVDVAERSATALGITPTPAHDIIRIDGARPGDRARIFSADGRLVLESDVADHIDIGGLADGVYFVHVGARTARMIRLGR